MLFNFGPLKLLNMRLLLMAFLSFGAALGVTAQDVHFLENTEIFGPVQKIVKEDTIESDLPDAATYASLQTTTYDRAGKLLQNRVQFYEGFKKLTFEYAGNCLKRRYEVVGYEEAPSLISVHFPDAKCKDTQIARYDAGKMVGRTSFSQKNGVLIETTYKQNNDISSQAMSKCNTDLSNCRRNEITEEMNFIRSWKLWPNGRIKAMVERREYKDGMWLEDSFEYDAKGQVIDIVHKYFHPNSGRSEPYVHHNTFKYLSYDKYGNWKVRQVFRITQSFGKTNESLEITSKRTFLYY